MKLAEALALRADDQKRLAQIKSRLLRNATVQEGEAPAEDPQALLAEFDGLSDEVMQLIRRINLTNSTSMIAGQSMTAALAERDILKQRQEAYRDLADAGTIAQAVVTRSEVRFRSTINIADIQKRADELGKTLRELDARIQEANWKLDLVD